MKNQLEKILTSTMTIEEKAGAIIKLKGYPDRGDAFCVHHDILVEYCTSFEERALAILKTKSQYEHLTRFLNFTAIPITALPENLQKACAEWDKACAEWDKAEAEWDKAEAEWDKACAEWDELDQLVLLNLLAPENTWNGQNIGWE